MAATLSGDLKGLQPSQIRQLERLYEWSVSATLTPEFVYHLAMLSQAVRNSLSCYSDTSGKVVQVALGTPNQTIFPPEIQPHLPATWRCLATVLHGPEVPLAAIAQHPPADLILLYLQSGDRSQRAVETEVPLQKMERIKFQPHTAPGWVVEPISLDVLLKPSA